MIRHLQDVNQKVWNKLFRTKLFVIVYHYPHAHADCEMGCCGAETTTVKGVASSEQKAEELIKDYMRKIPSDREDFEIEEVELNGEL